MFKYIFAVFFLLLQVKNFAQVQGEQKLQEILSKVGLAKFDDFKTYAAALKKDSTAILLFPKTEGYEKLEELKRFEKKSYRYVAYFDIEYNKADFTASSLERILYTSGCSREKFIPRKIQSYKSDSVELNFIMEEKNSERLNLEFDEFRFQLIYDLVNQKHKCVVEIVVTNAKNYVSFYNEDYFTSKLKPLVANNQFMQSSYIKNKDKEGNYVVFAGRNSNDYIKIQVEKDDETKKKRTILKGTFTYALDKNEKFLLPHFKSLVRNCYTENTADLFIDTDDIPTDTTTFDGAFGKIVQLTSDGFSITRNTIVATIVQPDDGIKEHALLNLRFNFYSDANDEINIKKYYWAKTNNQVDKEFAKSIQLIYEETKNKFVYDVVKNEKELSDSLLITVANADLNLRYFTKASIPDFNIFKADETSRIYVIKKLSGNAQQDDAYIQSFLIQLGNALPQNFIFENKFYKQYFDSKSTNPTIKINPNKYEYVFNEMNNYKFDKKNLVRISVQRKTLTNNDSKEETYLVIIFEKAS